MKDLRTLGIQTDGAEIPQSDFGCEDTANVRIIFREHKAELLNYIGKYNSVVGCVAWLTHYEILDALAEKDFVSIIVQKEDFLRPDINSSMTAVRKRYNAIPSGDRTDVFTIAGDLSLAGDPTLDAIRCMGNHNSQKSPAFPKMHHKFLVFTNNLACPTEEERLSYIWRPAEGDCVWTGSYNLTRVANRSLENVVILESPTIVEAYANEWAQVLALSEPLNWESTWCTPEWRIGT